MSLNSQSRMAARGIDHVSSTSAALRKRFAGWRHKPSKGADGGAVWVASQFQSRLVSQVAAQETGR